jgi:N-acetylmuramoyl-L-alanine amidase
MKLISRVFIFVSAVFVSLVFFTQPVSAEEAEFVDIMDVAEDTGAELRYDYWKGLYELKRGSTSVRFTAGSPWYLLNYTSAEDGLEAVLTRDGRFLIDPESADKVKAYFTENTPAGSRISSVVLDAGHGGKDPGAIGYFMLSGSRKTIFEKDVVLKTVLGAAEMLQNRYPDKEIILTRDDDRYLKLEERTEIANSVDLRPNESMIFISVHANASFNSGARGFEVWYLPPEFRRDLVDPEMLGDIDTDVIPILNTMLEEEYTIESVMLGEKLLSSIDDQVGGITENRGPKEESWFVVRNARMPSVLIELGFVTNPEEAALLSSDQYLQKLSKGIYNGVVDFVNDFEKTRGYSQ